MQKFVNVLCNVRVIKVLSILFLLMFSFFIVNDAKASFLEDTAGISASATLAPVDLAIAETAFKNIETRDSGYVVGSVALDGYDEAHDVHVYVTNAGNIIAYYLKDEPASKIVDWVGYSGGEMSLDGSKLEDALTKVCQVIGQTLSAVTYYDFRFPTATNIKIIADEGIRSNEFFKYLIPSSHTLLESSWSFATFYTTHSFGDQSLYIDGTPMVGYGDHPGGWRIANGILPASVLTPDIVHTANINTGLDSYGAVVFIYSE